MPIAKFQVDYKKNLTVSITELFREHSEASQSPNLGSFRITAMSSNFSVNSPYTVRNYASDDSNARQ